MVYNKLHIGGSPVPLCQVCGSEEKFKQHFALCSECGCMCAFACLTCAVFVSAMCFVLHLCLHVKCMRQVGAGLLLLLEPVF